MGFATRSKAFGAVPVHALVLKPVPATREGIVAEIVEWERWLAITPKTTRQSDRAAVTMRRLHLIAARDAMPPALHIEGA